MMQSNVGNLPEELAIKWREKMARTTEELQKAADKVAEMYKGREGQTPSHCNPDMVVAEGALNEARLLIKDLSAKLKEQEWQPIETAPKGTKVIVSFVNGHGQSRTVMGMYLTKYALEYSGDVDDWAHWSEEHGEYFCPEGWYEDIESQTSDDCGHIQLGHKPTHWMPLRRPPKD